MDQFAIVPGPRRGQFVELSRSRQGRVFRKQILRYGELRYPDAPGGRVLVDDAFADKLIANFTNGVCPIVQIPKVDGRNQHTEDPDRNIGEVINIGKDAAGIYVDMDVRTSDADKIGKTLLGTSAMLHLNYTDTRTLQKVGPTLLHNAVTNRPYVTDLDGFEEVIAASQLGADIDTQALVLSPADDEEIEMTLEEMLEALKNDHGIDVGVLQATAESSVALSNKIQEQLVGTGLLTLSTSEQVDADTLIGAVAEAGNRIVELSTKVDDLIKTAAQSAAETEIDKLILSGHILPKKREPQLKLRLSDPETFRALLPEEPIVKLSHEHTQDLIDQTPADVVEAEIDRLSKLPTS